MERITRHAPTRSWASRWIRWSEKQLVAFRVVKMIKQPQPNGASESQAYAAETYAGERFLFRPTVLFPENIVEGDLLLVNCRGQKAEGEAADLDVFRLTSEEWDKLADGVSTPEHLLSLIPSAVESQKT